MAVKDYSTNPDENITISGINIGEGCSPSGINNAIRQVMADVKEEYDTQAETNKALATTVMTGASSDVAGKVGLVPEPAAGKQNSFLRGDGEWIEALTGATETEAGTAGPAPAPKAGEHDLFLRGDGTWAVAAGLPLGHFFTWPFSTPPNGSIIVNGATYSRSLYADLWAYVSSNSGWVKTESEWQSIASANGGFCPYYSDGDGSTTFRVPKFAPHQQIAISAANAGVYHEAGLPNIRSTGLGCTASFTEITGAMKDSTQKTVSGGYYGGTRYFVNVDFNAANSNTTYSDSVTTVQPESNEWIVCVVAYGSATNVGNVDVANVMSAVDLVQANVTEVMADVATRLPDTTPHIVETWNDESGNNWYRKWSDGWIEQGGQIDGATSTLTFSTSFSTTNYFLSATDTTITSATGGINLKFSPVSNSHCTVRMSLSGDATNHTWNGGWGVMPIRWYACGY